MKKHAISGFFILFIVLVSLYVCQKLFRPKFYTSHDGEGHVIRMIEYHEAVSEGQFPVRIAKRINYGLGYPFFNFNYPLPYLLGEGFHRAGLSFIDSFKMLFIVSTIIAGIGMFIFMLPLVGNIGALLSALFSIIAPYRFLNMYVRGNPSEYLAWSLLPFVFIGIDRLCKSGGKSIGVFIFGLTLLILSSNTVAVITIPFIIGYILLSLRNMKGTTRMYRSVLISLLFTGLITCFFWLPAAAESHLTKLAELGEDYPFFFPTLREIIYSPWGFGAYKQGIFPGKMSPQIGLVHVAMAITACVSLIFVYMKHKKIFLKNHWREMFFTSSLFVSLFLMLQVSKPLWDGLPFLNMVQLPWRFLGIVVFSISILCGYVVSYLRISTLLKIILCLGVFAALLYTNRNHIRVNMYTDFSNPFQNHLTYGFSTTSKDEHMPKSAPRIHEDPDPNGDIIPDGAGYSKRLVWKSNMQQFIVVADIPAEFRASVSYFPGWAAYVDGKPSPILYNTDEYQRLRIRLPVGTHTIVFKFGETWYRTLADCLSIGSAALFVLLIIRNRGKNI